MKRILIFVLALLLTDIISAQELFVFTEPASNMPAKSIGLRAGNLFMPSRYDNSLNYHFIPEIMFGLSKNLMMHAEGFMSNRDNGFQPEGGAVYAKYRFLSKDDVFRHTRFAAFGRLSATQAQIHQQEIEINGFNSGFETGLISTFLLHKFALSATASYQKAINNFSGSEFPSLYSNQALNYSFSFGKLMYPKTYTNFKQVNINVMLEFLGQSQLQNGESFLDIAPSLQFIFNSQTRIDLAYRQELFSDMSRAAPNGFIIRVEHLLFNVF